MPAYNTPEYEQRDNREVTPNPFYHQ